MIASTNPKTHNPRISAQTLPNRLREIGERHPYAMYVLYAAFLFWPRIHDIPVPARGIDENEQPHAGRMAIIDVIEMLK